MNRWLSRTLWLVALVGFAVGLYGLYQRFTLGHAAANYGSYVPWGLWIATYVTFVGASAGALAVAAIIFAFRAEAHYPAAHIALLVALAAFATAMLNVWLDLGHPLRVWKLMLQTSFTSVMGWMAWFYTLYAVLLLVGLWLTRSGKIPPLMQRFAGLVLLFAVAFAGAEGALFGVVGARAFWESGLTPILFLIEGALYGLGLVAAATFLMDRLSGDLAARFGRATLWLLAALVVVEWAEFSTGLFASVPAKSQTLQTIVTGEYWWVFWIFHVGLGIVLPGLLLLFGRMKALPVAAAGLLISSMGLASKLNLVIPALAQEELQGLSTAFSGPGLSFSYFPSTMEWLVLVGTISLALLIFLAGSLVLRIAHNSEVA